MATIRKIWRGSLAEIYRRGDEDALAQGEIQIALKTNYVESG